jgi:hypothetical protein
MTKLSNPVAVDGTTAYVVADPAGIGATIGRALDVEHQGQQVRHVVVTGARPGGTGRGLREWVNATGGWFLAGDPYVTPNALRVSLAGEGRTMHVSRAESWFGLAEPDTCVEAMRVVRHVVASGGARVTSTPGRTGLALLRAMWANRGQEWEACPPEVCELLRSTSGQGRFELFDAGRVTNRKVVAVDARFQYAALARTEMPIGEPLHLTRGQDAPNPFWPAWCEVDFWPNGGPIGLLGVMTDERRGWEYPTTGGPFRTWCSGAELMLANTHGYRCEVQQAYVWPNRAKPLAAWADKLIRERERVATLPLGPGVVDAVRGALRGLVIQAVGMMHGRPPGRQCIAGTPAEIPPDAYQIKRDGDVWRYTMAGEPAAGSIVRPEWSTRIWSLARYRLASQMIAQPRPVIACALDGFYVAGEPHVAAETGRAGEWRQAGRWSNVPALENLGDLYRVTRG